jgi:hypothetical protein
MSLSPLADWVDSVIETAHELRSKGFTDAELALVALLGRERALPLIEECRGARG